MEKQLASQEQLDQLSKGGGTVISQLAKQADRIASQTGHSPANIQKVSSDARVDVLPYDELAAVHTGQIRAELAKVETPIEPYDQMIAGHAHCHGLIVVTNNVKEFDGVDGLRVENWLKAKQPDN